MTEVSENNNVSTSNNSETTRERRVIRRYAQKRSGFGAIALGISIVALAIVAIVAIVSMSNKSGCCCCQAGIKESLTQIIDKIDRLIGIIQSPESNKPLPNISDITNNAVEISEPNSVALTATGFLVILLLKAIGYG